MTSAPRKSSLFVIFLTVFIDLLGFGMVLPLLPIYADQFADDTAGWQVGALMASFSVMQFLCAPLWGRLSDRIGRRPVIMIGLAGSVVFYTLFGIATIYKNMWLLFASRVGAGAAGATISTAQAYIADSTSLADRPKGMALIGMAFGLGFTFGPLFGFLAVPSGHGDPGPAPGFAAAGLSAVALLLAFCKLDESRPPEGANNARRFIDLARLRDALATPSVALLLLSIFVCIFSFANFETTVSLLIKGSATTATPFRFTWGGVCLTYAYIGFTLALVQGGVVRRVAGRVSEGVMAAGGALVEVVGFAMIAASIRTASVYLLIGALGVVVAGFAFMQPSLNSLLSRRSDPARQGGVLGIGQSVSSLARICGAFVGIPMIKYDLNLPYAAAVALMLIGAVLVTVAAKRGADYAAQAKVTVE